MKNHKKYTLLLITILLLLTPAIAQAQRIYKVRSKYYNIESNLPKTELKRWAKHMDLVCKTYYKKFQGFKNQHGHKGRFNMVLVKTNEDFINYLAKYGINGRAAGGMFFYNQNTNKLITWIHGIPESFSIKTLQHEGFHQFNYHFIGTRTPNWANEGMAEYFGDGVMINSGKSLQLGIGDYKRIKRVQGAIERGTIIPFGELIYMDSATWRQNMTSGSPRGSFQYAQSWSICYFLMHGERGKYKKAFGKYFKNLSYGMNNQAAFRKAFKTSNTRVFNQKWLKFMSELKPDESSAAIMKLEFLAQGLQSRFSSQVTEFNHVDQIKDYLQKRNYESRRTSHGGEALKATDESLYTYTIPKSDRKYDFTVTPASQLAKEAEEKSEAKAKEKAAKQKKKKRKTKTKRKKKKEKEQPALPPQLSATAFEKQIILTWELNDRDSPVYRIHITKPKKVKVKKPKKVKKTKKSKTTKEK